MKKLIIYLLAITILACKDTSKREYVLFSGKIENTKATKILIKGIGFNQETNIKNGEFSDTLNISENGFYDLIIGRKSTRIYLKQGDNSTVNIDVKEFNKTIQFTGNTANENNYLVKKAINNEELIGENIDSFYSLNETSYKAKVDEMLENNRKTLNEITSVNEAFLKAEKKNLTYEAYALLSYYSESHASYTGKENFQTSKDFLPDELKNMVFDNEDEFKSSSAYQSMAFRSVINPIFKELKDFSKMKPSDLKSVADIKIPALKDLVVEYLAKIALSPENSNIEGLYTLLNNNANDEELKKKLKTNFDISKVLVRGKPSPTFSKYENHKGGTTSLSDLKGKYVYIDVWATWCGPCIAEIPSLKKIEKDYHDKNITFVSTSVDTADAYKAWKDMVNEEELGGIQLLTDNNLKSQFVTDYVFYTIYSSLLSLFLSFSFFYLRLFWLFKQI